VWQKRWLDHRNGAQALIDVVIASSDVAEATARFERFLGRKAQSPQFGQAAFALDRGQIQLVSEALFASLFPEIRVPRLPFIGAYAVRVRSLRDAEAVMAGGGLRMRRADAALIVPFPEELGTGAWVLVENSAGLPWRA